MPTKQTNQTEEDTSEIERRTYAPDCWVIVRINGSKVPRTYYRILAGWYGGFAHGDSWKLSSGIEKVLTKGDDSDAFYEAYNASGSLYVLSEDTERLSSLTRSVYGGYQFGNPEEFKLEMLTILELKEEAPELFVVGNLK